MVRQGDTSLCSSILPHAFLTDHTSSDSTDSTLMRSLSKQHLLVRDLLAYVRVHATIAKNACSHRALSRDEDGRRPTYCKVRHSKSRSKASIQQLSEVSVRVPSQTGRRMIICRSQLFLASNISTGPHDITRDYYVRRRPCASHSRVRQTWSATRQVHLLNPRSYRPRHRRHFDLVCGGHSGRRARAGNAGSHSPGEQAV